MVQLYPVRCTVLGLCLPVAYYALLTPFGGLQRTESTRSVSRLKALAKLSHLGALSSACSRRCMRRPAALWGKPVKLRPPEDDEDCVIIYLRKRRSLSGCGEIGISPDARPAESTTNSSYSISPLNEASINICCASASPGNGLFQMPNTANSFQV